MEAKYAQQKQASKEAATSADQPQSLTNQSLKASSSSSGLSNNGSLHQQRQRAAQAFVVEDFDAEEQKESSEEIGVQTPGFARGNTEPMI